MNIYLDQTEVMLLKNMIFSGLKRDRGERRNARQKRRKEGRAENL